MNKDYDKKYFENLSGYGKYGGYSKMQKDMIKWYNGIFGFLKRKSNIDLQQGNERRILDVGCAYGYILSELNKNNFKTYGVDISDYSVKISKNQNKTCKVKLVDIQKGIPFEEEFDFILCLEVIEHLQNLEIALRNIYSSLKKGGHFIVTTPNPDSKSILYSPCKDPTHISLNSAAEWIKLMKKAQFKKIDYWTIHAVPLSKYLTGKVEHISVPDFMGGTILMVCKK